MLNLSVITDDETQAVHCRTLDEARIFFYAVEQQRPDISTEYWAGPPSSPSHYDAAYMLSHQGCKSLKVGSVKGLKRMGVEIIPFDKLITIDLPEIDANQTGILSLLGL